MIFIVSKEEQDTINIWIERHDRAKHIPKKGGGFWKELFAQSGKRYSGAIGGAYSYVFTPTGIGIVFKVKCSCGEVLDLTDYDSW
jgi:hypothetical protein